MSLEVKRCGLLMENIDLNRNRKVYTQFFAIRGKPLFTKKRRHILKKTPVNFYGLVQKSIQKTFFDENQKSVSEFLTQNIE